MLKMIISDLDGTLLNKNNKVLQDDINAIHTALQNGIDFCLASGRKDIDIQAVAAMIGPSFHRISQNGAFIISKENEELHRTAFAPAIAKKVYEQIKKENVITILSTIDTEYVEHKNEAISKIEKNLFSPIKEEKDLPCKIGTSIHASKIIINGEGSKIRQLQKDLVKTYSRELDLYISDSNILDVMPKNISKGNAVRILLNHLGIDPNQIACIGDSFNDIPMFQLTKYSFAMSTADSEVKREATYVVDTVAEAIEQILKLSKASPIIDF